MTEIHTLAAPARWPTGHVGYLAPGEHEARMLRWLGLRPHPRYHHYPCPRRAAGRQCTQRCLCTRRHLGVLDHCRGWRDQYGRTVVTAEPYHGTYQAAELAELTAELGAVGVELAVVDNSLWCPGHASLLVMFKRPAEGTEK
jgi:hypothetical protein